MKNKKITPEDKIAAENLRRLWDEYQSNLKKAGHKRLTQEKAGEVLDMTQGAVNQYLSGKVPLGTEVTLKFARLINTDPRSIRPDFEYGGVSESPATYTVEQTESLAEEKALSFCDEFEVLINQKLDPSDKRELFQIKKTQYKRALGLGNKIPGTIKELKADVVDFYNAYKFKRG